MKFISSQISVIENLSAANFPPTCSRVANEAFCTYRFILIEAIKIIKDTAVFLSYTGKTEGQRNAIKGANIERQRRRSNIFVASQFWSLASGTKELLSRSRRIYCIPSRAISSRGSFRSASRMRRRAKYGRRDSYPSARLVSEREGIVTVREHFSCSLF